MKVLVLRFSSFGDVTQCLSVVGAIHHQFPEAKIHWVTREDFAPLLSSHPGVHQIWSLKRHEGLRGLYDIASLLANEKFTHVYDAHNNLRSRLICWFLWWAHSPKPQFLRRPIYRLKRLLLFQFRLNLFEQPFSGQRDLVQPLQAWGIPPQPPPAPQLFLTSHDHTEAFQILGDWGKTPFWCVAASAAHALKRWPISHWKKLIRSRPNDRFVLLGGPEDHFYQEMVQVAPERVLNLAGKCGYRVSAAVIAQSQGLISNDTGAMHLAEQLGHPCIALMGPAPFGFPCRPTTTIMELKLSCRPCSKHGQGPCRNQTFQKCLVEITPSAVSEKMDLPKEGKKSK